SQLTAYMLVNNVNDLQLVSSSLSGKYALGRSFSAAGFTGYAPRTTFTGVFDGNGGLADSSIPSNNYIISNLNLSSSGSPVALLPFVETGATVRNLNLANVNITGTGSPTILGVVAGENRGTISNVHVLSGTVNGGSLTGVIAGGLVGQNKGLVENSTSAAAVSVGDASSTTAMNIAGGLVGTNLGAITGSAASGDVSGGGLSMVR